MGALGIVSHVAAEGTTTAPVVVLIGLAVGIDYSLFYIRRERAERRLGAGPEAALDASAATVGRAILIAGTTVIIGLAGLLFTGNAVFVSMALGAILVVAIAVLGSLTVLPGDAGAARRQGRPRPALAPASRGRRRSDPRRTRVGRLRRCGHRAPAAVAGARAGAAGRAGGADPVDAHRQPGAARTRPRTRRSASPSGRSTRPSRAPTTPPNWSSRATGSAPRRHGHGCSSSARRGQRLTGNASGQVNVRVSRDGDTALVEIPVPTGRISTERHNVDTLRSALEPATQRALPGATAQLTGGDASDVDFTNQMNTMTPLVIAFVLGAGVRAAGLLVPLAAAGGVGDRAEPGVGRRRVRGADARVPAPLGAVAARASSRSARSSTGCRCSRSWSCSACRWTTRC